MSEATTTQAPKLSEKEKYEARIAKMQAEISKKYPHALVDTLTYDAEKNKFKVRIKCVVSGNTDRWVYTSDLFQVTMCEEEAKKAKAAKKAAEKAAIAEFKASKKAE